VTTLNGEKPEKSGVPGTQAHRAALRQIIDAKDQIPRTIAKELGLTKEQEEEIHEIIQAEYEEPCYTAHDVIGLLEGLLSNPELGPGLVYEHLEDHQSILMHHVAARCYASGLKAVGQGTGSSAGPADPESENE
jgi:hypothetical protein